MENCNNTPKTTEELRRDFFVNKGGTFWTVDEAESEECFNNDNLCFVPLAFVNKESALDYLSIKGFGGKVYNPAGICETVYPL